MILCVSQVSVQALRIHCSAWHVAQGILTLLNLSGKLHASQLQKESWQFSVIASLFRHQPASNVHLHAC